ncbi:hypothetical protein [Desulfovibrio sp. JC010]|uniref:hypothetical protein n=1 Tax=Desulfovibrio sp. JC010 TaxID=2593641 RepID=UPI0013D0FCB4|nr:hypothetical protein [Desulfovibrio sp. JC010]NDV28406.1 hypothetical protein [Desulfovibrio sp. JC010]
MLHKFLLTLMFYALLCGQAYAGDIDPAIFLPSAAENIILKAQDGSTTKRRCKSVSDGNFHIEERTRLAAGKIQEGVDWSQYPPDMQQIMKGEKDIVNNYILRADGPRITAESLTFKGEGDVLLDLQKKHWIQHGKSNGKKIRINCKIVKRSKKKILGKLRTLLHVELTYVADGATYKELKIIASGLWVIHRKIMCPGPPTVLITLEEDLNFK